MRHVCGWAGGVAVALLAAAVSGGAGEAEIFEPGATVVQLAGNCAFTEGPTADAAGNVLFTDQPNNRILRWGVDGALTTFLAPAGRANGMCFDRAGNLFVCADEKNELWRIGTNRAVSVVVAAFAGKPLNGPNDVWVHPSGALYFTDPYYQRPWWSHAAPPQGTQQVYRVAADGTGLRRLTDDLQQPNGLVGTADGRRLFVADIKAGRTWVYAIAPDGALTDRRLFCEMGSDGMTLDSAGNVFLTGRGVYVFDAGGRQVAHLDVPERWTANVCLGGSDRRTLFITASKGLYSVRVRTPGTGQGK